MAKQTASTAYISPEHMPYYPVIHGKNYAYVLQISGVNVDTGESETRFITVTTDNLMTPQQLSDSAYAIAEGNYLEEGFQFETMDIVTGYRDYTLLG